MPAARQVGNYISFQNAMQAHFQISGSIEIAEQRSTETNARGKGSRFVSLTDSRLIDKMDVRAPRDIGRIRVYSPKGPKGHWSKPAGCLLLASMDGWPRHGHRIRGAVRSFLFTHSDEPSREVAWFPAGLSQIGLQGP